MKKLNLNKKLKIFIFTLFAISAWLVFFSHPLKGADNNDSNDNYYDPFIDYNEFDSSEQEEEDINFFTYGRFLSAGIVLGPRLFTQTLGEVSSTNVGVGLHLDYFFSLRSSLQISLLTGNNTYSFFTPSRTSIRGSVRLTSFGLGLKYYFDPQNLIKPIAVLNPYSTLGYSLVKRTMSASSNPAVAKEDASSFKFGGGIEFYPHKRTFFIGLQVTYNLVQFSDEQVEVFVNEEPTGIFLKGDMVNVLGILGVNF